MQIPDKVKQLFDKTGLVSFGTADKNGVPNIIAVFWKKILNNETILLVDCFMNTTVKNLSENNQVCLSFWDAGTEEAAGRGPHSPQLHQSRHQNAPSSPEDRDGNGGS